MDAVAIPAIATPDNPTGLMVSSARVRAAALPIADLKAIAGEKAQDPTIFEETEPYFFSAVISTDQTDTYFTRMTAKTLQNYAADAEAGVSFQNSHNNFMLGLGRSIVGKFVRASNANGTGARTEATFYTMPGLAAGAGLSTDELIRRIRSGITFDVSVGFYGGEIRCSICKGRMLASWSDPKRCNHYPGIEYEIRDKTTKDEQTSTGTVATVRREVAIGLVDGAHLAEVSAVYDGSCPGAGIVKAQQDAAAGRLNPAMARRLEAQYRSLGFRIADLKDARHVWPSFAGAGKANTKGASGMFENDEEQGNQPPAEFTRLSKTVDAVRLALVAAGIPASTPVQEGVDHLAKRVKELTAEVDAMKPLAEQGRAAWNTEIEDALKAGVVAHGNDFNMDAWRGRLGNEKTVEGIRDIAAGWKKLAPAVEGGRKVKDDGGQSPEEAEAEKKKAAASAARQTADTGPVPLAAYRTRR